MRLLKKIRSLTSSRDKKASTIKWLNIEFSSKCNLRCKWCSLDHSKPLNLIKPIYLKRVIDEIADSDYFKIDQIDLHNAGETLLHPQLEELLAVIATKKNDCTIFPRVNLLTNAVLLKESMTRSIIGSGVLDLIRFSVDGGSIDNFEIIRRGAVWDIVRDNIYRFIKIKEKMKSKVKTGIICIVPHDKRLTLDWMDKDFRDLLLAVDKYQLRYPHAWDGSIDLDIKKNWDEYAERNKGKICKYLMKNLVVLPNGDVTVCCADLNSRGV